MKTQKIILIAILIFTESFAVNVANAQQADATKNTGHEFSISVGGGLSTLQYSIENGSRKGKFGGNFGLSYSYFFSSKWGIGTGVELAFYKSEAEMDPFNDVLPNLRDQDGSPFEFRSVVSGYNEDQTATLLNIPIVAHFRLPVANNTLQLSGGVKVGIPVSGKYKSSGAKFENTGYFTDYENETSVPEFMGFGTYTNHNISKDADYKAVISLTVDAGMLFSLYADKSIYAGVYFDYGLNDMVDKRDQHFIDYTANHTGTFSNNGVLESGRNADIKKFTDKVIPMAVGVKLRFALGL